MTKKLTDFKAQQRNANKHTLHGSRLLEKSLQSDGWIDAQTAAADGEMISGSKRLEVAVDKFKDDEGREVEPIIVESDGTRPIIVVRTDIPNLDDPRARRLSVAANQIAHTDYDMDGDLLKEWVDEDKDIRAMFADSEWTEITGEEKPVHDAEPQIDRAAELLEKWQVTPGSLWQIGEHRLICGDCTDAAVVARVMGGEKAAVCLTDPPYGLDAGKKSGKNNYDEYKDTRENLETLASKWLPIARDLSTIVVFSPGVTNAWIYPEADWVMCWFYGGGQLRSSWGFNCWQPFLCYGKDPSLASGHGARPDAVDMNTPANAQDLDHPCPKPEKLWQWFIERLSFGDNDIFFEPFSGSGTTLVACQNLGRRGRAIEISPAYCAVTLQRMSDAFPGIDIKRIE